ncbi:MAG: Tar ligand binding domain-containing protein, partial [Methylotenera sp.]|nr:Tar ligand binding domain-containing protein [Methylotenera sp.]
MDFIKKLTVAQRILALIALAVGVAIFQAAIGLYELSKARNSLKSVYEDRMIPIEQLNSIGVNMLKNRTHINAVLASAVAVIDADKKPQLMMKAENSQEAAQYVEEKIEEISKTWKSYIATNITPEEQVLVDKFAASRGEFVKQILRPAIEHLRANDYERLTEVNIQAREIFIAAETDLTALKKMQLDIAENEYKASAAFFESTRFLTFAGLILAIVLLLVFGLVISRSIIKALGAEPAALYDTAKRVAAGDLDFTIALAKGDATSVMAAMVNMQANIKALVADAAVLAKAALDGRLATRADANRHQGDFRKVVSGVNDTLDSVIGPLNVAANYVDRISKGDIPVKITDHYNGDFNTIKNNLNTCIDAVNSLVAEAVSLENAAIDGRLATRADATKYQGDFRKVVEGVNNCLDAVINPLNVAAGYVEHFAKGNIPAKITDNYNGDFNIIKNNLNACVDALSLLVTDANMLAQAAQDDRLDTRADATKHWGDYRKVVEGVNGTLDTVMQKTAADAAEKAQEAQALADAVEETQTIIEGAKAGDLSSRVPLVGKTGAIASLCDGVNALMDKMTEVIIQVKEAGETINTAAGEIASGNNDLSS